MSSKTIFLIDDDPTVSTILVPFLKKKGYDVLLATNGEDAIDILKKQLPQLILLDVQMPRMNGYSFIIQIQNIPGASQIPIIVMTAKDGMAEIFKVEGAKEYLTKPVDHDRLLELLHQYIGA